MRVSTRIWLDIERLSANDSSTVTGEQTARPGRLAALLGLGLLAVLLLALLPGLGASAPSAPRLVIFPPGTGAEQAFKAVLATGGQPIITRPHLPFGLVGLVASFPTNGSSPLAGFSVPTFGRVGCLSLSPTQISTAQISTLQISTPKVSTLGKEQK
jgi:hypothetical protein